MKIRTNVNETIVTKDQTQRPSSKETSRQLKDEELDKIAGGLRGNDDDDDIEDLEIQR